MEEEKGSVQSAFQWNAGAWFGTQLGCTLWMGVLGLVVLSKNPPAAIVCIVSFLLLNSIGLYIWRRRANLNAYIAIQIFLAAVTMATAVIVVLLNRWGVAEPAQAGALVSTELPFWAIAVAPALMVMFFFRQRQMTDAQK